MATGNEEAPFDSLVQGLQQGRKGTADQLFEWLYPELRRMAAARLRSERRDHSWQPTLLVNELYLELLKNKALDQAAAKSEEQKAAFMGLAGFLMRRLLILHSRPLRAKASHVPSDDLDLMPNTIPSAETLTHVDALLGRLGEVNPSLRTVVELRVFEGKTNAEIAAHLGVTERTVGSYWSFARQWLEAELSPSGGGGGAKQ